MVYEKHNHIIYYITYHSNWRIAYTLLDKKTTLQPIILEKFHFSYVFISVQQIVTNKDVYKSWGNIS